MNIFFIPDLCANLTKPVMPSRLDNTHGSCIVETSNARSDLIFDFAGLHDETKAQIINNIKGIFIEFFICSKSLGIWLSLPGVSGKKYDSGENK